MEDTATGKWVLRLQELEEDAAAIKAFLENEASRLNADDRNLLGSSLAELDEEMSELRLALDRYEKSREKMSRLRASGYPEQAYEINDDYFRSRWKQRFSGPRDYPSSAEYIESLIEGFNRESGINKPQQNDDTV